MNGSTLRAAAISAAYRTAWATVARLPHSASQAAFNRVSDRLVRRRGPAVRQLARNLKRVLGEGATAGELHAVVQAAMRSYGRYWLETFTVGRLDRVELAEQVLAGSMGIHHVTAARDAGAGVIMALPHSGNWDIAGLSMSHLMGAPILTVAERLEPESLYQRFVRHREELGITVLPMSGAGVNPAHTSARLREHLQQGGMVCLLSDRDLTNQGVVVDFFGEPTTMPSGPALLAARTGAVLCAAHLAYTDGGWLQHFGAPLQLSGRRLADQVRGGTQAIADQFAERIEMFPADWHMLQPFWVADRPQIDSNSGDSGTPR